MFSKLVWRFHREETGTALTEYSVMLALVLIVAVSAIRLMGNEASGFHDRNSAEIEWVMASTEN